ncbi:hypothetical protein [Homoserinibacter sp. YIM 151385]|uniref:hypothetical protein n=1 Tax=Homoserinibacter sp. YIM 151385 TaxID=2985506 RepID=UPI0022F01A5E|nr:hypothetical protein [Homoserinibacter sp. YIM 151385]WBU37078.1 hypothetical protein OF852_09090 [Homoserinibacter sp. YIM 151385]
MPYDAADPRSALTAPAAAPAATDYSGMSYAEFSELPPTLVEPGRAEWIARAQNLVLALATVDGDTDLGERDEPEEHIAIAVDPGVSLVVEAGGERVEAPGERLVIVPPGRSRITASGSGRVLRLVRSTASDLVAQSVNAEDYASPHHNVPPFAAWPEPVGGYRIRVYDLTVPTLPGSPFRLYRCTTFMVNWIAPQDGPRDPAKLSPHHHDDFEQCSLVLEGEYVHHIRWPWTTDRTVWREDEHHLTPAPSLAVIPPPSQHTSEAVGEGRNRLVDIFSPPRLDFSRMPDWVLNAEDYPMPAGAEA